tara:strand:+ start:540 stop:2039 length:1500 start_codon:yes stop_codon:yes gene_type:complete
MKDIKENQQGLKSLASERPDVVKKMGYDPESFYAGGLAMLAEGGSIDFAALSKALGSMGGEETTAFNAVMGDAVPAAKASVTRVGGSMEPDDAIEEYKKRQAIEEIEDQKEDEEIAEMFMGGIMDYVKDKAGAVKNYFTGSENDEDINETMKRIDGKKEDGEDGENENDDQNEATGDKEGIKELTKEEKSLKVADGLAALSEGMGGMSGTMSKGFIGQPIGASMVPFTRVGMAEGGMAEGGIRNMFMGGEATFSYAPLANLYSGIGGLGDAGVFNNPVSANMSRSSMEDEQAASQREMLALIDRSPLSAADKTIQKQLINLQVGQQTLPLSPQYVASDAPYKALYRPYFSEVTKAYNAANPGPFSAMAAPPKERVDFNLGMQADGRMAAPRKVAGVEYANDGMLIEGKFFPETDELVSGPGGEREDKIPAMLSDGEFVVNARTVRGLGMQMGADPMDLEEQKDIGAMVLEYLQDTLGPNGEMAEKIGEEGLGALVRSMA